MERELFRQLCHVLHTLRLTVQQRCTYDLRRILEVYLWAVVHDRPTSWACQDRHWPPDLRRRPRPSQSQMSRRLRTFALQQLLGQLYHAQRDQLPRSLLKFVDGKPLPVGGCSKDPDAKFGHGAGTMLRGYKLVCLVDEGGAVDDWRLGSMNLCEHHEAVHLLPGATGCCLLGDTEFDKTHLYRAAAEQQIQLIAPAKRSAKALGHRRQAPQRLAAFRLLQTEPGQNLMATRTAIERSFGHATSFAGGLGPLPAWVRRPHRVALWVAAKFTIDATRRIRLLNKKRTA
jgi:hypothetical protein